MQKYAQFFFIFGFKYISKCIRVKYVFYTHSFTAIIQVKYARIRSHQTCTGIYYINLNNVKEFHF